MYDPFGFELTEPTEIAEYCEWVARQEAANLNRQMELQAVEDFDCPVSTDGDEFPW